MSLGEQSMLQRRVRRRECTPLGWSGFDHCSRYLGAGMRRVDLGIALMLVETGILGTLMSLSDDLWPAARRAAVDLPDHFAAPRTDEVEQGSPQGAAPGATP